MNEVASNYAEAFISLAREKNRVLEYKNEIDEISIAFSSVKELKEFFNNVKITKNEKKNFVESIFKNKISDDTLNFIKVIIDKGRCDYYNEIFKYFHIMANQELNIKEGIIESARPLSDVQINKLEKALGDNVLLKPRINNALISGFKIIFDDEVIDNSMKDRIDDLSNCLKERS